MSKTLAELIQECTHLLANHAHDDYTRFSAYRQAADWLTAQGVRVVPREVTEEMIEAALAVWVSNRPIGGIPMRAILEAALTAHDTGG